MLLRYLRLPKPPPCDEPLREEEPPLNEPLREPPPNDPPPRELPNDELPPRGALIELLLERLLLPNERELLPPNERELLLELLLLPNERELLFERPLPNVERGELCTEFSGEATLKPPLPPKEELLLFGCLTVVRVLLSRLVREPNEPRCPLLFILVLLPKRCCVWLREPNDWRLPLP